MDLGTDTHAAALRALTRFSTGSAVWLGLVGLVGLGYVATLGTSRDDDVRLVGLGVGSAFVLLAVVLLVALIRAGRRDLRAAPLVAGDRPERASGGPAMFYEGSVSLPSVLLAIAAVVFGIVFVPRAADGAAWGWITPVLMGVVALACGLFVRWRGNEYVGIHPDGIRMVRRGRLTTAPWHRVLHFESGQVGIAGGPDRAGVSGEMEARIREPGRGGRARHLRGAAPRRRVDRPGCGRPRAVRPGGRGGAPAVGRDRHGHLRARLGERLDARGRARPATPAARQGEGVRHRELPRLRGGTEHLHRPAVPRSPLTRAALGRARA
ncbi:hypothetical protein G5V59_06025 [Nocardioides sp. W3-2-3]|uniref:hypothetical protein n=1 Tax=Nocardioides convexus TaxID=2712224 RepID=UPI002418723B|nr:hypothetical protein [Nocardioides convexus]NGZ99951.1 hypothetical protein [Nocardioides convexus]